MSAPAVDPAVPRVRAVLRSYRSSASKARQVLDLIRGQDVVRALEILEFCDRQVAEPIAKLLSSAVANAAANEDLPNAEELVVSACWADEGPTLKRWRPRARGRATRIRKRTCHVTIEVTRLPEDRLDRIRAKRSGGAAALRERRVAAARRAEARRQAALAESEGEELDTSATVEVEVADAELVEAPGSGAAGREDAAGNEEAPVAPEAQAAAERSEGEGLADEDIAAGDDEAAAADAAPEVVSGQEAEGLVDDESSSGGADGGERE